MSLFQCQNCGCCENTALSSQGFIYTADCFDWSDIPDRKGMRLCSACGPSRYADSKQTPYGKWHGRFPRTFLPKGKFKKNERGNLEHIETGDEDFFKYALEAEESA